MPPGDGKHMAQSTKQKTIPCTTCRQTGMINNGHGVQACPMCEGAGQLQLTPARIPIWYILGPVVIAANATVNSTLQIQTTADFEWVFTMSVQTSPLLNLTVIDGSVGRLITQPQAGINTNQGCLPITLFAGTAQQPFPLVEPYIIARSSSLLFNLTDLSGAQNTITLALQGFQLIPQDAQGQGSSGMLVQSPQ
jgi:hypothetical protein